MLVDTDVMIWHLRGHPAAAQRLNKIEQLTISAVTYMELLQGIRNREELAALQKSLEMRKAEKLPLTPAITSKAIRLMEELGLSHGMQMGDAFIAATALEYKLTVLTGNLKHFKAIPVLNIERFEAA
jgi:predicted nucleic acid-binding protein